MPRTDFQINVKSPNTLVCSSFVGLSDLKHLPVGFKNKNNSSVIYVNLGAKDRRMGGSVISQIYDIHEKKCPKLDNVENFIFVIELLQSMHEKNKIVSYHDISDGALLTTIADRPIRQGRIVVIETKPELYQAKPYSFEA